MGEKETSVFGKAARQHFDFHPEHRNLNHGSFGTSPREIRKHMRYHQDLSEAKPDSYIRYDYPIALDESREAMAKFLNVPTDTVVFVSNATVGVNTILRALTWDDDGKDEILYFSTVYSGCGKMVDYIVDTGMGRVSSRNMPLTYPCEDADVLAAFHSALADVAKAGKRAKVCIFDTVSSLPGVAFPYEEITKACRAAGILSLVDGAQGVGMIDLDLAALDADFFVSNCHKWLFVPRGCAVLYVPLRNQHLIKSTVPTSHGYIPQSGDRFNPLPPSTKPAFVNNFEFVGTIDTSPYVCVKTAIEWRERVFGSEVRIREYMQDLAREGGKAVAQILGTEVMENSTRSLSKCAMTNVALPLDPSAASMSVQDWMNRTMVREYKTFVPMIVHDGRVWARLSAQVYLDLEDFEWTGRMLRELCERVERGEARKK